MKEGSRTGYLGHLLRKESAASGSWFFPSEPFLQCALMETHGQLTPNHPLLQTIFKLCILLKAFMCVLVLATYRIPHAYRICCVCYIHVCVCCVYMCVCLYVLMHQYRCACGIQRLA